MGVISVGASLGVAEKAALRPNASPPAASAQASATVAPAASNSGAGHATTQRRHEYANANHHHYHNGNGNTSAAMSVPSQSQQVPHSGRNKRGGRRKYVPSNPPNPSTNGNIPITMVSSVPPVQMPPPPIITALGTMPVAQSASTSSRSFVERLSPAGAPAHVYAPPMSAQVVRSVAFLTNADPQLLMPLLVGTKSGSKLHAVMNQAKCSISYRPPHPNPANTTGRYSGSDDTVIRISSVPGNDSHRTEWKLVFTVTAETVKRVDHGIRLLQGAIEATERSLSQKLSAVGTAGVVASLAVDSGGNSIPSSGHVSASSAIVDLSIDNALPSGEPLNRAASSSSSTSSTHNRDSVDERKAQTRIRYPPTNQPQKRGPGFVPSRIISESSTTMEARSSAHDAYFSSTVKPKSLGKKRQLPSVGEDITDRTDAKKRERLGAPAKETAVHDASSDPSIADSELEQSSENVVGTDESAPSEFDEFRIRMTRGIAFSRQVEAEAAAVRRRLCQEKKKYLKMIHQAQRVSHQQRVADVVIRTQCAIMATGESNNKKRRRIEQLSAVHDSLGKIMSVVSTVKRMHMGSRYTPHYSRGSLDNHHSSSTSPYSDLLQKIATFRALISSNEGSKTARHQEVDNLTEGAGSSSTNQCDELPTKDQVAQDTADEGAPHDTDEDLKKSEENESFRSLFVAPGVPRDMNLIQDYTDESECGLLRVLVGQRQYFYLEPITLTFGLSNIDELIRYASRSPHDLEVLRAYALKNRRFGANLMKNIESIVSNSIQAMASSKAVCWTSTQHILLELHPLLLALHLLALHYHVTSISSHHKPQSKISSDDVLTSDGDFSADLFKFVLRPIRSSAIESSLHDALPISLVRETIAHCPEVVNHVLDWREEHDVPASLLHDVSSLKNDKTTSGKSELLNDILKQLQRYGDDFDRSLSELCRHLHGNWPMGVIGDKVIYLVNQLKSIGAHILVANTRLQLHKWTTVFVENGFTWFDEDLDDGLGSDMTGDRSYDKFTCLQDALLIWHKVRVLYSARDTKIGESNDSHCTIDPHRVDKHSSTEPECEDDPPSDVSQRNNSSEDRDLIDLQQITPPEVMSEIESLFTTREAVASFVLTSSRIADVRRQFDESINEMRASMKVLGRTAPWRTHVKHSNALKIEYKKQRELQKQLLLHQWAVYYKDRPLPNRPDVEMEDGSLEANILASEPDRNGDGGEAHQEEGDGEDPNTAAPIVIEAGDTPEVVDMKMLRHEIEGVAKQMQSMGTTNSMSSDRKRLIDACSLLASSCISALSKFLDKTEVPETKSTPGKSGQTRIGRQRANSTSKLDSSTTSMRQKGRLRAESVTGSNDRAPKTLEDRRQLLSEDTKEGDLRTKRIQPQSPPPLDTLTPSITEATHKSSPRASVTLPSNRATRPPPTAHSVLSNHTVAVPVVAEPLRMGCSGCRDTRRRCTGCHGCCLHCVCTGCGCRMCCSSRAAVVQKTLNLLVSAVETRMGCKWIALDARIEKSERCGMVKTCELCQQCSNHCTCHPAAQAAASAAHRSATTTAGFPNSSSRKERRFRINPTAAHRRQTQGGTQRSEEDSSESKESRTQSRRSSSASRRSNDGAASKRTRRSNSDANAPPLFSNTESMDPTTDFTDFQSGSSNDGFPFVSNGPLPSQHKDEQEDLFRAARVRMKLQRNTFLKPASHPYGSIPPNTLIEGDMLWQPGRIRLMWERKDVYGVLGVPRDASPQLIKRQYRKLVLKLHPDKVANTSDIDQSHATSPKHGDSSACSMDERVAAFVAVTQAYKLLSGEIGAIHNNAWRTTA